MSGMFVQKAENGRLYVDRPDARKIVVPLGKHCSVRGNKARAQAREVKNALSWKVLCTILENRELNLRTMRRCVMRK